MFLERVNTGTSSLPPPEYIIEELGISLKCMQLFDSYPGNFMCVCGGGGLFLLLFTLFLSPYTSLVSSPLFI